MCTGISLSLSLSLCICVSIYIYIYVYIFGDGLDVRIPSRKQKQLDTNNKPTDNVTQINQAYSDTDRCFNYAAA